MAEARSSVRLDALSTPRPRSLSTGEVVSVTKHEIQQAVYERPRSKSELFLRFWFALGRSTRRAYLRAANAASRLLFPSTPISLYVSVGAVYAGRTMPFWSGALQAWLLRADAHLPYISTLVQPLARDVSASLVVGTGLWVAGTFLSQRMVKLLLGYKGFLHDGRSKSFGTALWAVSLRVLLFRGTGRPLTHSYDGVLPALPVPALSDTVARYLASMQPLLVQPEFERLQRLARDFQQNQGFWLQILLKLKFWFVPNYVTDWWERFVYLRWREPMMINSNYYIMDAREWRPTNNQLARAANLVYHMMRFNTMVQREEIAPVLVAGVVPLCMQQYCRIFGTTRIPILVEDRISTVSSKYIVVLCRGYFYAVSCFDEHSERLTPRDLEGLLKQVANDAAAAEDAGLIGKLPVLTGGDRDQWAAARTLLMADRHSAAAIECIERAAFVVCLDEATPVIGPKDASAPCPVANALIHGSGANRWFDKSFNLVVFANGKAGLTVEHSWADAPVPAHMMEWCLAEEFMGPGYDDLTGCNKALMQPKHVTKPPVRLRWGDAVHAQVLASIDDGLVRATDQINDLDLRIYKHDQYSKGIMKKFKVSPDAYIQMALQLAYYRDKGELCQTYEASMTRLFALGRTETVRPVTMASAAFVQAMINPEATNIEREALLRAAVDGHVALYRAAMSGEGVDRHLFCLYVSAIGLFGPDRIPEFLKQVKDVPWALSTSQTPAQQTTNWDLKANPNKVTGGGGFGPVHDDGYGVSYIIATDDVLLLHVSSKVSSPVTSSQRFIEHIVRALADMKNMLEVNSAARKAAAAVNAH